MTTDTAGSSTVQKTVEMATPGDAVELTTDSRDWETSLEVIETEPAVEWDVPYGTDWWCRTITVQADKTLYAIEYTSGNPPCVECYLLASDTTLGEKHGDVEYLAPATTEADEDDSEDTNSDGDVALPDGMTPADVEAVVDENRESNGKAKLGDVADALGVPVARARTVLVALDLYGDDVREVYRSSRGGRR